VFGKPDLTFKKLKIAIFVDSEFWHGKDWVKQKQRINTNRAFWWAKIERNIQRDRIVKRQLIKSGWKVLRFWGNDIQKKLPNCIYKIEQALEERRNN
jgi:DNA mismatch endonuclease Vsr